MAQHLSALELDELAAGLAPPPPHLEGCASCRARVEELRAGDRALLARPEAQRRLAALTAGVVGAEAPSPRRWRRLALLAASLAAGLALFLVWPGPPDDGVRLKGAPAVLLLDAADQSVTRASPGETLTLAVGTGGYTHGAVFALDADGRAERLWPREGDTYGPLPAGARVRLRELRVTPGDVTVRAVFANEARALLAAPDEVRTVRLSVP
jgi:hypothetical protein